MENEETEQHPSVAEFLRDYINPYDLSEIFSNAAEHLIAFSHISNERDEVRHLSEVIEVFADIIRCDASTYADK